MKTTKLWKSMKAGMMSGSGDIVWELNTWRVHDKPLVMCKSGFHASVRAIDAMRYVNCEVLAEVEVKGKHLKQGDKQVWEKMRVLRAYKWTKRDSAAMAIYSAELVIDIFEKRYPDDKRPRKAIEAARAWFENPAEKNRKNALAAYRAATSAAAYASAAYAASSVAAAYSVAAASSVAATYSVAAARATAYAGKKISGLVEAWIMERVKTLAARADNGNKLVEK